MIEKIAYATRKINYDLGFTRVPPPRVIFLNVNSTCNLHCKMCDIGMRKGGTQFYNNMNKHTNLDPFTIRRLVDEVERYHPTFAITSTEPLLYNNLFENVIRYMKDHGCKVQLTTNGLLLPKYADDIYKYKVDSLWISIDGPKDVHNFIRGNPETYQNLMSGLSRIRYLKTRDGSDKPSIQINYTIGPYNYMKLVEFLDNLQPSVAHAIDEPYMSEKFALNQIFDHITFSHLNFITEEMSRIHNETCEIQSTQTCATHEDLEKIDKGILWDQITRVKTICPHLCSFVPELSKDELYTFYNNPMKPITGHDKCKVPWFAAQIFADGSLGISTRCYNLNLGNIHDESFMKLWNGKKMRDIRKILRTRGILPACTRCCGVL